MIPEYFIDKIGNISVQGPVISFDLGRMVVSQSDNKTYDFKKRAAVTLTGQNFLALVNSLNQTVKAISVLPVRLPSLLEPVAESANP